MYIKEFLKEQAKANDNLSLLNEMFKPFTIDEPSLKSIVCSLQKETVFFEDEEFYRLLSLQEVLDFEKEMFVDIKTAGIIPLIDCGENNFISYCLKESCWCVFDVAEEFLYNKKQKLLEFFNK